MNVRCGLGQLDAVMWPQVLELKVKRPVKHGDWHSPSNGKCNTISEICRYVWSSVAGCEGFCEWTKWLYAILVHSQNPIFQLTTQSIGTYSGFPSVSCTRVFMSWKVLQNDQNIIAWHNGTTRTQCSDARNKWSVKSVVKRNGMNKDIKRKCLSLLGRNQGLSTVQYSKHDASKFSSTLKSFHCINCAAPIIYLILMLSVFFQEPLCQYTRSGCQTKIIPRAFDIFIKHFHQFHYVLSTIIFTNSKPNFT